MTIEDGFLQHRHSIVLQQKAKHWTLFYRRNANNFFKDRHWTDREFTELLLNDKPRHLLEVGCGSGSFLWPLLDKNPQLSLHCCDFAPSAIALVQAHPQYSASRIQAFVCDITHPSTLSENIPHGTMDLISAIFVLSALTPSSMDTAVANLYNALAPGGTLLFRDYAQGDLAQTRFKPESRIEENLFYRADGTLSYFFSETFLKELFERAGFTTLQMELVEKKVVNRKQGVEMHRIFIQAKFGKSLSPASSPSSSASAEAVQESPSESHSSV
jgi:methyltransferase-like protein 6